MEFIDEKCIDEKYVDEEFINEEFIEEPIKEIAIRNLDNTITKRIHRGQTLSYKKFILDELFNCFLLEYVLENRINLLLKTYFLSPCDENKICFDINYNYSYFVLTISNKIYITKKLKKYVRNKFLLLGSNIRNFIEFIPVYARNLINFDKEENLIVNADVSRTQIMIDLKNFDFVYMTNTLRIIISNICKSLLQHPKTFPYMYSYRDASGKFKNIPMKNYIDAFLNQLFLTIHEKYEKELSHVIFREKVSITSTYDNRVIKIDFL